MSDHSKRTRSQLALPEEFGEVHFGISPLRAARQERRRNLQTDSHTESFGPPAPPNVGVGGDESDDELLLSPPKTRPPKRPSLSQQQLGFSSETDSERLYKRLKRDHNDEQSHIAVTETRQPSGPFDFSAINQKPLSSSMSPGQPSASSKQRAHTVPLVSPTIRGRDLGQLMPSPGKESIVPLVHDVLRFSSLPCSFEPLADRMDVNTSEKSEPDRNPARLRTPPPPKELDSSSCKISETEVKRLPSSHNELPFVATGLDVMTFTFAQLPAMTHQTSPERPDSDVTPKPINRPPTSPSIVDPIPLAFGDPSSLSDDPPSPLSALSSLSELDSSPPPGDSEVHSLNAELPSGIPRAIQPPPSSAPSRATTKDSGEALPQVARVATATSRDRGGRGFMRSSGSARSTRSASTGKQKEVGSVDGDTKASVLPESSVSSSIPAKRSSDSPELAPNTSKKSSMAISHKKAFSFAMPTSSSLNKAIDKTPASSPLKPSSLPKRQFPKLPSPMKPASSLGPGEPPHPSKHTGLSNLSLALEKLKIPPPSRPATTLGFNSDTRSASKVLDSRSAPKARDDSAIRLGNGLPAATTKASAMPLRRVVTVGSVSGFGSNAHASSSKPAALIAPPAHSTGAGPSVKKINLHSGIVVGKNSLTDTRGFVYGGVGKRRPFEKVSKKSSLPVVEASPVKETGSTRVVYLDGPALPSSGETPGTTLAPYKGNDQAETPIASAVVEPMKLQEAFAEHGHVLGADSSSAKDGQTDMWKHASRRASLASQFLQQTLAVLPSTPPSKTTGSMSKASERLQSSSQSTRTGLRSGSNSDAIGSRSTARIPSKDYRVGAHVSRSGSAVAASTTTKLSSLRVLKSCTIFVDVRTDDGDDAGGLFVDMLRGLGAKIIGRAGQSCTHIVYKNGLMSTLTKYRLMREPKPFVIGISWVVECAEQCRRVGEENFLVDLEGVNIAGNKRRRSMLPKHISSGIQAHTVAPPPLPGPSLTGTLASDQSMDGSSVGGDHSLNSSDGLVEDEDDLPPLERARQRRNILFKP